MISTGYSYMHIYYAIIQLFIIFGYMLCNFNMILFTYVNKNWIVLGMYWFVFGFFFVWSNSFKVPWAMFVFESSHIKSPPSHQKPPLHIRIPPCTSTSKSPFHIRSPHHFRTPTYNTLQEITSYQKYSLTSDASHPIRAPPSSKSPLLH